MWSGLHRAVVLAAMAALVVCLADRAATRTVPEQISDRAFWQMITAMSENGGSFVSDNIISNEVEFQRPIPDLLLAKPGGVYVGPEQNFTYITALKPSMAFIVDIRRVLLDGIHFALHPRHLLRGQPAHFFRLI